MYTQTRNVKTNPIYRAWTNMIHRCRNSRYKYHKGKGIKVCGRWLDYENFLHDMGADYEEKKREVQGGRVYLDRIDNNLDYHPSNCRRVDQSVHAKNSSRQITVEYMGGKRDINELAEAKGLKYMDVYNRLVLCRGGRLLEKKQRRYRGPVEQWSLDGKYIKTYRTIKEGANGVGLKKGSSVTLCIKGERETAGGYKRKIANQRK